jgi:hypothetical protein
MEIHVHCPGNGQYQPADRSGHLVSLSAGDVLFAGEHELIKLIAQPPDLEKILETEVGKVRQGKLLVSGMLMHCYLTIFLTHNIPACVDRSSRRIIQHAVVQHMTYGVKYHEHEFQPSEKSMLLR